MWLKLLRYQFVFSVYVWLVLLLGSLVQLMFLQCFFSFYVLVLSWVIGLVILIWFQVLVLFEQVGFVLVRNQLVEIVQVLWFRLQCLLVLVLCRLCVFYLLVVQVGLKMFVSFVLQVVLCLVFGSVFGVIFIRLLKCLVMVELWMMLLVFVVIFLWKVQVFRCIVIVLLVIGFQCMCVVQVWLLLLVLVLLRLLLVIDRLVCQFLLYMCLVRLILNRLCCGSISVLIMFWFWKGVLEVLLELLIFWLLRWLFMVRLVGSLNRWWFMVVQIDFYVIVLFVKLFFIVQLRMLQWFLVFSCIEWILVLEMLWLFIEDLLVLDVLMNRCLCGWNVMVLLVLLNFGVFLDQVILGVLVWLDFSVVMWVFSVGGCVVVVVLVVLCLFFMVCRCVFNCWICSVCFCIRCESLVWFSGVGGDEIVWVLVWLLVNSRLSVIDSVVGGSMVEWFMDFFFGQLVFWFGVGLLWWCGGRLGEEVCVVGLVWWCGRWVQFGLVSWWFGFGCWDVR